MRLLTVGLLVRAQLGEFIFFVNIIADVAQLAEQLICNQQVIGSSPIIGFGKIFMDL